MIVVKLRLMVNNIKLLNNHINNFIEMATNNFFPTEISAINRPQTSSIDSSKLQTEEPNLHQKLRQLKKGVKYLQKKYGQELTQCHRIERTVNRLNHTNHIKRADFLKVYSNKKYKFQNKELLENNKHENDRILRQSHQQTKRKKLEKELGYILLKNEQQDQTMKRQIQNKREKDNLRLKNQQRMRQMQEQANRKFEQARKGKTEFLIRKNNIHTAESLRSKRNFMQKRQKEWSLIKQYNNLIDDIGQMEQKIGIKPMVIESLAHKTFITTNNTIDIS